MLSFSWKSASFYWACKIITENLWSIIESWSILPFQPFDKPASCFILASTSSIYLPFTIVIYNRLHCYWHCWLQSIICPHWQVWFLYFSRMFPLNSHAIPQVSISIHLPSKSKEIHHFFAVEILSFNTPQGLLALKGGIPDYSWMVNISWKIHENPSVRNGWLVGGLVAIFSIFPEILGCSSSQLTNSIIFQRGGPGPPTRWFFGLGKTPWKSWRNG